MVALRKAMLNSINEARLEMVENDMDVVEKITAANRDAADRLMEVSLEEGVIEELKRNYRGVLEEGVREL